MANFLQFGEDHSDYAVRVLNEREVRGAAGIMFIFAMFAFMTAWFVADYSAMKLTITAIWIDFSIRVLINPRFSPTLIMARRMVSNQTVEHVGAPQKRFAWAIGLGLATLMMYLVVINDTKGPINMIACLICLMLLFLESSFGICIGCKLYNLFNKEKAQLCPGNVCALHARDPIQKVTGTQALIAIGYVALLLFLSPILHNLSQPANLDPTADSSPNNALVEERCLVPEFARKMGHEEKWKLHNGC